ncbi:MAG: MarR family winged helix-turn-helix transcriptional regulator [Gammaproteobacteria bacterium]
MSMKRAIAAAEAIHPAAIVLLRHVRQEDVKSGLGSAQLSALSVIVYGGPVSITALAAAEQVSKPTMSLLVKRLEAEGLIERQSDPADARVSLIRATPHGRRIMAQARDRRLRVLADRFATMPDERVRIIEDAANVLLECMGCSDEP